LSKLNQRGLWKSINIYSLTNPLSGKFDVYFMAN
jgi:hypothetical protein